MLFSLILAILFILAILLGCSCKHPTSGVSTCKDVQDEEACGSRRDNMLFSLILAILSVLAILLGFQLN